MYAHTDTHTHTQPCSHAELETVLLCWGLRQKRVSRNRGRGRIRVRESQRQSEKEREC